MKNYIYIFLAIFSLSLISCEKEIDFNGKITDPLLVVNCLVEADSTIWMDISTSNFFLDNKNHFDTIKNADVKLYINNVFKEKINYISGFIILKEQGNTLYRNIKSGYHSVYRPISGDSIKITVKADGFDEVSAYSCVVKDAAVLNIESSLESQEQYGYDLTISKPNGEIITIGRNYSGYSHVKIKVDDPADETNYYRLAVSNEYGSTWFEKDDPVFGNSSDQNLFDFVSSGNEAIFSDELFNGQKKEVNFSIWKNTTVIFDEYKELYGDYYSNVNSIYYVDLQQISKETYLYLKSRDQAVYNNNNPFSEPVQIYTNINGGIGVLGTINKMNTPLEIP